VRAIAAAEESVGAAPQIPSPHSTDPNRWRAGSRISLPVNFAKQEGNAPRSCSPCLCATATQSRWMLGLLDAMEAEHTQPNGRSTNSSTHIPHHQCAYGMARTVFTHASMAVQTRQSASLARRSRKRTTTWSG
jgi:hypothetical protein